MTHSARCVVVRRDPAKVMTEVVPGRQNPIERRRAAMSRISAADEAMRGLLQGLTAQERSTDPDGLLLTAARALLGVAQRFEGRELIVSAGPEHRVAVRIRDDGAGPQVELVHDHTNGVVPRPSASEPEPAVAAQGNSRAEPAPGPRPEVATELADLLRRREVAQW
jgi:hypothetical protein